MAINPDLVDKDKLNAEFPNFPEYTIANIGAAHTAYAILVAELWLEGHGLRQVRGKWRGRYWKIDFQDRIRLSGVILRGNVVCLIDKKAIVANGFVGAQRRIPEMLPKGAFTSFVPGRIEKLPVGSSSVVRRTVN